MPYYDEWDDRERKFAEKPVRTTMIETSFDYLIADAPISAVNVPLLGK